VEALNGYAETSEGDVKALQGQEGARLRSGKYRAIFLETEDAK
jgi:mRNA interferase RelE/StbE